MIHFSFKPRSEGFQIIIIVANASIINFFTKCFKIHPLSITNLFYFVIFNKIN